MLKDGTIPAHITGNMWAGMVGPVSALQPYPGVAGVDRPHWWLKYTRNVVAAEFLHPLACRRAGLFHERSMLVRPRDRDVVCHASA